MDESMRGQLPVQRHEKAALLKTHLAYLQKQKQNPGTARGVKQPVVSEAYPPSITSIRKLKIMPLSELRIETHHRGQAIIVKTISKAYRGAGSVSVVEDEKNNVDKLAIYNHSDTSILSNLPEDCVVAVKEPYYKSNGGGNSDYMICVDHPCDVLLLGSNDQIIPRALRRVVNRTAEQWKKAGEEAFLDKDFPTAVFCYNEGVERVTQDQRKKPVNSGWNGYNEVSDAASSQALFKADLLSKKAGINLILGKFDDAQVDAVASCTDGPTDWKAYLTAGRAAYGLRDYYISRQYLQQALELKADAPAVKRDLDRCLKRLAEEKQGVFDFKKMFESLSPRNVHLDNATFTARTVVKSSSIHGRGIFAREKIKVGDLVFCEKSAAMPNQYDPLRASPALYARMVRQLYENPSKAENVLKLHGGDHVRSGFEGKLIDGVPIVDVWLVEAIRQKNCFSAPLSTREDTKPGSNPNVIAHTKGLWPYASHLNHSCVPNTVRSFIGDMLLSRALRDIEPGEELTQSYTNIKAHPERRQADFRNWGFQCCCALCDGEANSTEESLERRVKLLVQIEKLANKKPPKGHVPDANIRTMEKLTRELEEAHEPEIYGGLPRLMLVYPALWLLQAYKGRNNHAKVVATVLKAMRNFGFHVREGEDVAQAFNEQRDMPSILTIHLITLLREAANAHASMGSADIASRFVEAAKSGYMMLTGFENDLSLLDVA